jgi:hypothetical protein
MKLFLSLLTVAVLLAAGFFGARLLRPLTEKSWDPTDVYAVWISGIEVSSTMTDGQPWNEDGTAPNLVATLSWRDTMLLETPEASHTLIARWDRTAVKLKEFLKTELSPNAMENVARIHGKPDEIIAVEVKDRGLIGSRWVGAVTIPCGALKPGENELVPEDSKCSITSLTLTVAPSSVLEKNGQIPTDKHRITQGITKMDPPPPDETGDFKNSTVGKGIQEGIKAISGFLKKEASGETNP